MRDQVLWRKIARIIIPMDLFYRSHTFELLNNPETGLQLMSDQYIFEDFCKEMEA